MADGGDSDVITGPVKTNHAKAELLVIIIVIKINRMIKITPGKCLATLLFSGQKNVKMNQIES